jgi:ubiquinone/menaquinone biosynthesis C-methylase UbiE
MNQNDQLVSQAFSNQSKIFDLLDHENKLTEHLRNIYRAEIDSQIKPGSNILELNCGTGIDTLYFANKGHHILATDNAQGMLDKLSTKVDEQRLEKNITVQRCSFTELDQLGDQKFDYIISNFGGLNCTQDLSDVLRQFNHLLNEGGKITLVIMPKISPWELVMALKGKFKTAFRRFRKNTAAHVEGVYFSVYYFSPSYVTNALKKDFKRLTLKGIYFAVPPEFYQNFVERYPKLYKKLQGLERLLGNTFPFNRWCDHYMITLQKK